VDKHRAPDRTPDQTRDWRELCKAAATELDPAKLMDLIAELTRALDEREKQRRATTTKQPDHESSGPRSLQHGLAV
jgi:hypothetical protein